MSDRRQTAPRFAGLVCRRSHAVALALASLMVASMRTDVPFLLRAGALEVQHALPDDLQPFGPDLRAAMSIAVEEAWRTLIETGSSFATEDQARVTQEVLALRVVDTARMGESDPVRLKDDALKYLAGAHLRFCW
jgi:hypothetical protein